MKLVTKNIHYAIKSLLYLAQEPQQVISARTLASTLKIHRPFLRKILQILSKHKILKSLKGKGGGFILNVQPYKLRIIDVVNIFQLELNFIKCIFAKEVCSQVDSCLLRKRLKNIEDKLRKELNTVTIATLSENIAKKQ